MTSRTDPAHLAPPVPWRTAINDLKGNLIRLAQAAGHDAQVAEGVGNAREAHELRAQQRAYERAVGQVDLAMKRIDGKAVAERPAVKDLDFRAKPRAEDMM